MTHLDRSRRQLLACALPGAVPVLMPRSASAQPALPSPDLRRFGTIAGEAPQPAQLRSMGLVNYGHFTTIQVEGTAARGMDFQIARLQSSTRELFRVELAEDRIRAELRAALASNTGRVLVRVNVFPLALDWMDMGKPTPVGLLVTQSALPPPSHVAQRVMAVEHERAAPGIKHVGTFSLFQHRRQAQLQGFDDALFFDRRHSISEGTTWNVAFHDGSRFVFPTAPALPGGATHLLRSGMRTRGVPHEEADIKRSELRLFRSCFLTNIPAIYQPILQVDDHAFAFTQRLHDELIACYESSPLMPV